MRDDLRRSARCRCLLGILYEQVTEYLGFLHSSDEYKVMALASYGEPVHVDAFRSIVHRGRDGFYTIEPPCLEQRFGPPAPVADRWTNTTSISPTRCKSSWRRLSSTSPAGCMRPPASAISAWPGASR